MRLDNAAIAALNLLPSAQDTHKASSLYGRLNSCKVIAPLVSSLSNRLIVIQTAMGARKLMAWIRQPLTDAALIESRLDVVEALVSDTQLRGNVPLSLKV
jgi:DNA mismatch repair ATPase MutS